MEGFDVELVAGGTGGRVLGDDELVSGKIVAGVVESSIISDLNCVTEICGEIDWREV